MKRSAFLFLEKWLEKTQFRKPLIIRGARQVGKTYLIREFAKQKNLRLVEINLEKKPEFDVHFKSLNIEKILAELGDSAGTTIDKSCLLFLDEIQSTPSLLPALRYFYEERPDISVVCAGSLLEFVLSDHSFSMPVGRVSYYHLTPLSFSEFLEWLGEHHLLELIHASIQHPSRLTKESHEKLLGLQRQYLFIGGMPAAVASFLENRDFASSIDIHQSIMETYKDDFSKYKTRLDPVLLNQTLEYLAMTTGNKVIYSHIDPTSKHYELKKAVEVLKLARLWTPVYSCSGQGVPLGATRDASFYKPLFLDVGLKNFLNKVTWKLLSKQSDVKLIDEGSVIEQFVGQSLVYAQRSSQPELFYWVRGGKQGSAEVNYLSDESGSVIPIEVKAGVSGKLKSLHLFMATYKSQAAIRFDANLPSNQSINLKVQTENGTKRVKYNMHSLPTYFAEFLNDYCQAHF